jgi:ribosome production factor 2
VKNVEHDELGDQFGRIHMERQDFSQLQTRKMKGLKRRADEDEDMASDNDDDDDIPAKPSRKPKGKGKRTRSN